jgi:hypothetical protein
MPAKTPSSGNPAENEASVALRALFGANLRRPRQNVQLTQRGVETRSISACSRCEWPHVNVDARSPRRVTGHEQ